MLPYSCSPCPAGQWQATVGATYCLSCNTAEWCPGADVCKTGHQGLACSECTRGWFLFQVGCCTFNPVLKAPGFSV